MRSSLADALREVAFVTPRKEDFLDGELEGAWIPVETTEDPDHQQQKEDISRSVGLLKGPLELDGSHYDGHRVKRNEIFEASDEDSSLASIEREADASTEASNDGIPVGDEDLYEAYKKIQSDVGLSELKKKAIEDRERGLAVRRDKQIWEKCLELRIGMQKPFTVSHRLPPDPFRAHLIETIHDLKEGYSVAKASTRGLLDALVELEDIRLNSKRQKMETETDVHRDELNDMWESLEGRYAALKSFCTASLDRFHRQAMLQSGATTKKGSLSTLHRGISSQVEAIMQTPNKMLQKSRIRKEEQPNILGMPVSMQSVDGTEDHPEMFVDTEFYQTLLNAYLTAQGMEARPIKRVKRSRTRQDADKKLNVLFTCIQEKLINFMTPLAVESPGFAKQLFQNLFGGG